MSGRGDRLHVGVDLGIAVVAEGGGTQSRSEEGRAMEFMLVLYEDPELIATEEQRKEAVQRVGEYAMGLVGDGTLKGGAPLHPVTEAKRVRIRGGQQRILDGPFAESKEVIAGY